jgi:RHS repeat-associated protein
VYVYEPGTFRPLALARRDGPGAAVYRYHLDHLGTPQELTDGAGRVAWAAEYRAWGALARERGAAVAQPLRFPGQYADAETGLHYTRHRYYSPAEGRFIHQDPIGLAGGLNVAAYAPNPVAWVDPLGLSCTFDAGANRWRDASTGRFRARPSDPVELVRGGRVNHADVDAWAGQQGLPNSWTHDPVKFPSGGFRYNTASGGYNYQVHGHGANPSAPPGSNSAAGPTVRISRRPAGGASSTQEAGLQSGAYGLYAGNQNAAHIPLDGSPY